MAADFLLIWPEVFGHIMSKNLKSVKVEIAMNAKDMELSEFIFAIQ